MIQLNDTNGASRITLATARQLMEEFPDVHLVGAEFGVAYGGGVEALGKLWAGRGTVYGFDTFEGHPKEVADECEYSAPLGGSQSSFAAGCMDQWYKDPAYGTDKLSYGYQVSELARQGIDNVFLIKGKITGKTNISYIKELHYCLLDLDFPLSMWQAYHLIKDKVVRGGYLCLHDVIPQGHIPGCWEYYQQMLAEGLFELVQEHAPGTHLVTLRKL